MTFTTTTDHAAALRAAYKAKGWNSRMISVRAEYYSMGSSLHITIKNPAIPYAEVERIASGSERIDRDQFGDILSGGNRFVYVKYSDAAAFALTANALPMVTEAAERLAAAASDNTLIPIGETRYMLGNSQYGRFSLWGDSHIQNANELDTIAYQLAVRMQGAA